jgi:hypothetical protein
MPQVAAPARKLEVPLFGKPFAPRSPKPCGLGSLSAVARSSSHELPNNYSCNIPHLMWPWASIPRIMAESDEIIPWENPAAGTLESTSDLRESSFQACLRCLG